MNTFDAFDTALQHFYEAAEQTRIKYKYNRELHDALAFVYEDVARCLLELKDAVVLQKQKDTTDEEKDFVVQY